MSEENNVEVPNVQMGEVINGKVVKTEEKQVLVDIGYKTEGIIPISELSNLHVELTTDVVQVGDELTVKVKKIEDDEVILSKKDVQADEAWKDLEEKYQNGDVFETEIKEVVKGGLVADVGVRGFMPASLVETYYVEDFSDYINKPLTVKIVDLDREQNSIILSHKDVVLDEMNAKKQEVLQSLEEGQVLEGTVQRLTNFGVFVNLGGIDGLVHISQLAHEHVEKPSDVVSEGDKIKVEVLAKIGRAHV